MTTSLWFGERPHHAGARNGLVVMEVVGPRPPPPCRWLRTVRAMPTTGWSCPSCSARVHESPPAGHEDDPQSCHCGLRGCSSAFPSPAASPVSTTSRMDNGVCRREVSPALHDKMSQSSDLPERMSEATPLAFCAVWLAYSANTGNPAQHLFTQKGCFIYAKSSFLSLL